MAARIVAQRFAGPLAARLQIPDRDALAPYWLGQAGFVMRAGGLRILVDPYLSDTLGDKYRGTTTPHDRMMPVPVSVEALGAVDLALLTHHHTDHMDPGTLVALASRNPALEMRRLAPDLLLLLPVNGRSRGVLGNLTLEEACALAAAAGAPAMIAHHFGMCAFNTNPREAVEAKAADLDLPFRLLPASEDLEVQLEGV